MCRAEKTEYFLGGIFGLRRAPLCSPWQWVPWQRLSAGSAAAGWGQLKVYFSCGFGVCLSRHYLYISRGHDPGLAQLISMDCAAGDVLPLFAFLYRSGEIHEGNKVFHCLIELMMFWWLLLIR